MSAPAGPAPRRSPWPWVFLALWVAWIIALAWLGRAQWGVPRDGSAETRTTRDVSR
jgi:hypothetical protein